MKRTLIAIGLAMTAAYSYGQGYVNFANTSTSTISNIVTGARIPTGNTYLAQLYYGAAGITDESLLRSVADAPIGFGLPGRLTGGGRLLDASVVAGGAMGTFQIRAWEAVLGANYDTAYQAWSTGPIGPVLGKSALIQAATANGAANPLPTPAPLSGLTGFYLQPIPEPGVLALGALGLVAVLWRRRQ